MIRYNLQDSQGNLTYLLEKLLKICGCKDYFVTLQQFENNEF